MADETTASVIPLHYGAPRKSRKSTARAKAQPRGTKPASTHVAPPSSEHLIPLEFLSVDANDGVPPVAAPATETVSDETADIARPAPTVVRPAVPRRRALASYVLVGAALCLAVV